MNVELSVQNIVNKVIESNIEFHLSQEKEKMTKNLTTLITKIVVDSDALEGTIAANVNRFLIEKGVGVLNE